MPSDTPIVINGFDRADGLDGREGTLTPADSRVVGTAAGDGVVVTEEHPDSPDIERAEQCTITHRFRMDWNEALSRLSVLGRGANLSDSTGLIKSRVLSSRVQHQPGGYGMLTVTAESTSFDSPWDQFQITPVELGVNILKHPRYFYALQGSSSTEYEQNQSVIRALQNYMENPSPVLRNSIPKQINDSIGHPTGGAGLLKGTDIAKAAALEIIMKYWRNEETPYLTGYQITWASFFFRPQRLNPGGYIQDPITEGGLPDYFHNPNYPVASSETIFDWLPIYNPQCYSSTGYDTGTATISWMRKADEMDFERTWFKVRRIWIGSPVGYWDTQLYAATHRPVTASDYETYDPTKIPLPS